MGGADRRADEISTPRVVFGTVGVSIQGGRVSYVDRAQASEEMLSEVTEWLARSSEEPEPEVEPTPAAEADDSAVPRPSESPPPDTEALNSALERVIGKLGADGWEARITQQGAEKAVIESKPRKKHGQWRRLLVDVSGTRRRRTRFSRPLPSVGRPLARRHRQPPEWERRRLI
jgi:hypothetical protein